MMVDRSLLRSTRAGRGRLDPTRTPPAPVDAVIVARAGLEGLLAEELAGIAAVSDVRAVGPGRVRARLAGPLGALFAARTMLGVRFPLPAEWVSDTSSLEEAVARAITSDAARAVLSTWTVGPVRYRIAWAEAATGAPSRGTWPARSRRARRSSSTTRPLRSGSS